MIKKNIIKKIRIYPSCLYFLLEKWLNKMSLNGWRLIKRRMFVYYFERSEPQNREYFAWSPTYTGLGKYSISLRYPNLRSYYGIKKKNSPLNKDAYNKCDTIIEIDVEKFDIRNNEEYKKLRSDRNKLYFKMWIVNSMLAFLFGSVIFFLIFK